MSNFLFSHNVFKSCLLLKSIYGVKGWMKNKCHTVYKTLWKKEKLLDTTNFSFSHNVFHSYIPLVRRNVALGGNRLKQTIGHVTL